MMVFHCGGVETLKGHVNLGDHHLISHIRKDEDLKRRFRWYIIRFY